MEVLEQLKELWAVLWAIPGQVWLNAFYLFVILGVLKAVGVVRDDGYAAATNGMIAIFMNGGLSGITDLTAVLQTSGTAFLSAVFYILWKKWVGPFVGGLIESVKAKFPSK